MKRIAIYGKGGIGKSTITANLAAIYAQQKKAVLIIGCDPKHDTANQLIDIFPIPTIMGKLREKGELALNLNDFILTSKHNITCIEIGGPKPGVGCAGRGITKAFELLDKLKFNYDNYDVVIYDVLGDVVCGGFGVPLRASYSQEVYIVVSGEVMSLYAANNLGHALMQASSSGVTLGGIIANERKVPNEQEIVNSFAKRIGTSLVSMIPRHEDFQKANLNYSCVVDLFPNSDIANTFKNLANTILENKTTPVPHLNPMTEIEFEAFIRENLGKH